MCVNADRTLPPIGVVETPRRNTAEDSYVAESSNTSAIKKLRFEELVAQRTPHYRQADLTVVPCEKRDNRNADACVQALHTHLCEQGAPDRKRPGDQPQV